jgi:chaperonin GroES
MLKLDAFLTLDKAAIESPNLCGRFSKVDLDRIGQDCWEGFDKDEQSRANWLKRNEAGMDLALQVQKDKTFPWPGCANVAFPLVTIAAMQFHARAYPGIMNNAQLVKFEVFGDDPDGQKRQRATRVQKHMNWQLMFEDRCWEDQEDKAIFNVSIVGTTFKKSYYNASLGHNVSELVLAKDLIINYWAKSVELCGRKTHRIPKSRNEVYENVMRQVWDDVLEEPWYTDAGAPRITTERQKQDARQGLTTPQPDASTDFFFLEQHVNLDLDGDGYAEPYIITLEEMSKRVVRIVTRFDAETAIERIVSGPKRGKIIRIKATEYFSKRTFIPSPDGGIYDIGFGVFLGPLNEATNSLVNMLLDAGTMQTTAGGFLGRGAKIRGGTQTFTPFEWKRVDATGDDLRKNIVPHTVNQPSDVLFKMLGLLIDYASRVAGTTDITVGENPGQNTPAQTTQTMVEMGQKVYTAIFKRLWRGTREEFQKLFLLNAVHLDPSKSYVGGAKRDDYVNSEDLIAPMADPHMTSDSARLQQALLLKQASQGGGYDRDAVERRFLQAARVENIEEVYKGLQALPPPPPEKIAIAQLKEQGEMQRFTAAQQADQQLNAAELMEQQRLNNAKIVQLLADADAKSALAQVEADYAQVAAINAQIALAKSDNEVLATKIDAVLRAAELKSSHIIGMKKSAGVSK